MPKSFPLTSELLADQATWDERRFTREFPDRDPVVVAVLVVLLLVLVGLVGLLVWLLVQL